jgi:maltose O-acetyltransferase
MRYIFKITCAFNGLFNRIMRIYYKLTLGGFGSGSNITSRVFITHPYNVYLGEEVQVNEFAILQGSPDAQIIIGNRVAISFGAKILTAQRVLHEGWFGQKHASKSVIIGDDVWIAANSIVLPGVKVGTRSVIAAGAVVTHDVEPYTVVAGIPAKPIRHLKASDSI